MRTLYSSRYLLLLLIVSLLFACTKDFEEINTNPFASTEVAPEELFSTAILQGTMGGERPGAELAQAACYVQFIASAAFNWNGDKYIFNGPNNDGLFNQSYITSIKSTEEVLRLTKDGGNAGLHAAARIWRVMLYQRVTDAYGNIPYFEAGQASGQGAFYPKYDSQDLIYKDLLNELEEACADMNAITNPIPGDLLYDGEAQNWKRFGYSLMLRLAMRTVAVDATLAQQWSEKAIQGGLMLDNSSCAVVQHSAGPANINKNTNGVWITSQFGNPRLSAPLVDCMIKNEDPRLAVVANPSPNPYRGLVPGSSDQSLPAGLPIDSFTELNYSLYLEDSPTILFPNSEVEFLLAEAAVRGWATPESASAHYENGIAAAMDIWNLHFGQNIDNQLIIDYIANNPLSTNQDESLEQIGDELWLCQFMNPLEAWANWRRTGYPNLSPAAYPFATCTEIPRRFLYTNSDKSTNNENVLEAISDMGGDNCDSRVWWDAL